MMSRIQFSHVGVVKRELESAGCETFLKSQEDIVLKKLMEHCDQEDNKFELVADYMNQVFQTRKLTAALCEIRWYFHLDPRINKEPLTVREEESLMRLIKAPNKSDIEYCTKSQVISGFTISDQFVDRPPPILKELFTQLMLKCISIFNAMFGKGHRNFDRIRLLEPGVALMMFEMSDRDGNDTAKITYDLVPAAQRLMFYVENLVMHQIHRATDPRLTGIDSKDYEIITEAMILMDTFYRVQHAIKPYSLGLEEEAERVQAQIVAYGGEQPSPGLIYYNDEHFVQMSVEQLEIVRRSEAFQDVMNHQRL